MANHFETHLNLLTRELNKITKNINILKNKNHDSISKIVNNIKNISDTSKIQKESTKANYNKFRPIIYLYPTYKGHIKDINSKTYNKTINNFTITKSKFFLDKKNIINLKKNFYNKSNTINLNSNYNLNRTDTPKVNHIRKIKSDRNINNKYNKKIHIYNKKDINKILYFNYNNNQEFNKINKKHISIQNDYFLPRYQLNKNYNSINTTKMRKNNNYFRKNNLPQKEKKFLDQMCNIYNKYNGSNKTNNINGYDKIISWIKDLINKKEKNEENEYENFCKKLMKENNINDFSAFQNITKNYINEEKNANFFIKDMKKILFKDIT